MALWIIAGLVLIIALYFVVVKPLNYWKYHNVPQYNVLITLREFVLEFIPYRAISERVQKVYTDFPGARYAGVHQFARPVLALRDPDLIKQISVKDFDYFVDRYPFMPEDSVPYWGKTLLALKGDKWKKMRATLTPSFTSSKMKVMFELISDYAKQFFTYFDEQNLETMPVEMKNICTRFTTDVIATLAFGINCDSMRNPNNKFYLMGLAITTYPGILKKLKFLLLITLPKISKILQIELFPKQLTSVFINQIKMNVRSRKKCEIVRQDMIHLLLKAHKYRSMRDFAIEDSVAVEEGCADQKEEEHHKDQLSEDDIIAQVLIFFLAGFDTVATLMSFMAYELAVNVDVQERLLSEIDETLKEYDDNVTYEALSKMRYMDMVVAETLRKWPAVVATDRVCTKPYTIQPVQKGEAPVNLRKGDVLWIPVFGLHRDPKIFFDPERFDPERFNEENKSKIPPYCYIPFGMGPRTCIGYRFALMETKLLFFYILSKFRLTVTEKTDVPLQIEKHQFLLKAKDGIWLGLNYRN